MKMRYFILIALFFFPLELVQSNAKEVYPNLSEQETRRFVDLTHNLRCPKCQSSSLSGSNAPIAIDLKKIIYKLILEGKSNKQIKTYLKDRYGEYILYDPPINIFTSILWFGPFLLFFLTLLVILIYIRNRSTRER